MERSPRVPTIEQIQSKLAKTEMALNGGINVGQIFGGRISRFASTADISQLPQLASRTAHAISEVPKRLEAARPKIQEVHDFAETTITANTQALIDIRTIEDAMSNLQPAIESGSLDPSILDPFNKRLEEARQKLILKPEQPKKHEQPDIEVPIAEEIPQSVNPELVEAENLVAIIRQRVDAGIAPTWHLAEAEKELARIKGEAPGERKPQPEKKVEQKPLLVIDEQAKTVTVDGKTVYLSNSRVGWEVLQSLARQKGRFIPSRTIEFVAKRAGSTAQRPAAGAVRIVKDAFRGQGVHIPLITHNTGNTWEYKLDARVEFINKEDLQAATVILPNGREFATGRIRAAGIRRLVSNYPSHEPTTTEDLTVAMYGKNDPSLRHKAYGQVSWIREDLIKQGYFLKTDTADGPVKHFLEELKDEPLTEPLQQSQPVDSRQLACLIIDRVSAGQDVTVEAVRGILASRKATIDSDTLDADSLVANFQEGFQMIEADYNMVTIRNTWSKDERAQWTRIVLLKQKLGGDPSRFISTIKSKIRGEDK